ncbi:hypothetical protein [Streptomyces sp. DG1A-41]|uniref:hypothetical protein n=1 Tax=Streptomyces sp. DG1A-41 TaxID=3125779 RepID=UPI0030D3C157
MDETTAAHLRGDGRLGGGSRRDDDHDSRVLWSPGGNHNIEIANLSPADRASAEEALFRWTGQGAGGQVSPQSASRAAL